MCTCFVFALALLSSGVVAASDRPVWTDGPKMARWLVHKNDWGSLATVSRHLSSHKQPIAYSNAVSFSDGPVDNATGRLLFYLTPMDASAYDLQENPWATLAVAEAQLPHACSGTDPEDPTCAKVSLSGRLVAVQKDDIPAAEELMFSRHPAMRSWPVGHNFTLYEMDIKYIRLLDFYGGAKDIKPGDYFAIDLELPGQWWPEWN